MTNQYKVSLLISIAVLLTLIPAPKQAYAQWPPFSFDLTSSYEDGKISYNIEFKKEVEGALTDVTLKIPLPAGTRFLEARAEPSVSVDFDGAEITFFSSVVHRPLRNTTFVVEITDQELTTFTTHAWIMWKGNQPGDYLTQDVSIDITRQPLNWSRPRSQLRLETGATVSGNVITYMIYPKHIGRRRMWDLKINIPVPEGTTFLSAEAPLPFVADFDGREVSFFSAELERQAAVGPLRFKVSTTGVTAPFVVTHAWATWKNANKRVGRTMVLQEDVRGGDIIVQPHSSQQVVSDIIGDAPLANYDLTSLVLAEDGDALKATFYPVGNLGSVDEPVEFSLYIDSDCRRDTGSRSGNRGAEYRLRYRHAQDEAKLYFWDEEEDSWGSNSELLEFNVPVDQKSVTAWIPYDLFENNHQFCWIGRARNRTLAFHPSPSSDWLGLEPELTQYEVVVAPPESSTARPLTDPNPPTSKNEPEITASIPLTAPVSPGISGKLALPLNNNRGGYDVHIFSLPDGQELVNIPNARQPNFRFDGQRILINRENSGGAETVFEYNLTAGTVHQISNNHHDSHPFYDPWGNRVVYGNPVLVLGADGSPHPFIFVQCGVRPPPQEPEQRCQDIARFGILVPAGQMGEIWGSHPVWSVNDMIAYKGCNSWAGFAACGIYIVPSSSNKGFSDGFIPRQLTHDTSDIPFDTKDNSIVFSSHRDGAWEVYVMDLSGAGLKNLSNSPDSSDGPAAISPDGNWVAFISNRAGHWAIWAVPIAGGSAQKLLVLPTDLFRGDGDHVWTERISWGP